MQGEAWWATVHGVTKSRMRLHFHLLTLAKGALSIPLLMSMSEAFPIPFLTLITMKSSELKSLSRVRLFVTPWTVAYQAPPSMGFSRQEYWSGLPFPSAGDLPDPGIEPRSLAFQADALTSEPPGQP